MFSPSEPVIGWRAIAKWLTDVGNAKCCWPRARGRALQNLSNGKFRSLHCCLTNLLGLYVATGGTVASPYYPIPLLVSFVLARLSVRYRLRHRKLTLNDVLVELRKSWWLALLINAKFGSLDAALLQF